MHQGLRPRLRFKEKKAQQAVHVPLPSIDPARGRIAKQPRSAVVRQLITFSKLDHVGRLDLSISSNDTHDVRSSQDKASNMLILDRGAEN
jgi:hypothetical protein